jgi:multidrug efflux pump subunit AcrA (membrane-fusion protein)
VSIARPPLPGSDDTLDLTDGHTSLTASRPPRRPRRSLIIWGVLGVAAVLALIFGLDSVYGFLGGSSSGGSAQRTATVAVGTVQSSVSASGNVSVATSASANFGTSGTLSAVYVKVGDHVKAGQVLARLDPTTAQATVEAGVANLSQARTALATARAGLTAAQKASNASSLQQSQSQLASAQRQLATDEAAVTTAQQQLATDEALDCPPASGSSNANAANSASSGSSTTPTSSTSSSTPTSGGSGGGSSAFRSTASAEAGPTTGATGATGATGSSSQQAAASKPSVVTGTASGVGTATATLAGTVNPNGSNTTYRFQYGASAGSYPSSTARLGAGSGNLSVSVTANIAGLKAGRTYYFRLVASNATGTSNGADATFATTAAASPTVTTGSAASVLTKTATLTGTVNPNGSDTKVRFEYGTTAAYGLETPLVDAGSGSDATQVSAPIAGLKPDTTYLFRVVATNAAGTSAGIGQVMSTAASACVADATAITNAQQIVTDQQTSVATAQSSLTQTQATITASSTPSATTIAQDQAAVTQAKATLTADRKALAETLLRAPVYGTVTAVNGSVGDTVGGSGSSVSRGAAVSSSSSSSSTSSALGGGGGNNSSSSSSSSSSFITIESLGRLQVVSGFAEADASKLAVGQPATVTFPALTNVEVAGKVTAVSSTSTVVSNVVTYNATISLINSPSDVKEGMTANVAVVTQTRARVLELPSSAITTNGTVSTVNVLSNGQSTATRIQTGLVGSSSTEILGGLKAGDVVVIPTVNVSAATSSTSTTGGFGGGGFGGGGFGGGGFGGGGFRGGG